MSSFAQDIRPLFRDKDVEDMLFAFDLSQYEDVKTNAAAIYEHVSSGSMPCDGAWPPAQVAAFQQWMNDGFPP